MPRAGLYANDGEGIHTADGLTTTDGEGAGATTTGIVTGAWGRDLNAVCLAAMAGTAPAARTTATIVMLLTRTSNPPGKKPLSVSPIGGCRGHLEASM